MMQLTRRYLILLCTALMLNLSACQSLVPKAQGLQTIDWLAKNYQRQDQVEVQWKDHSFSFLLYQQQQGQKLEMLALTLTGQQLFQLSFDGQKVIVQQHIDQMKLLPFDFLVRDILFATYPNFAQLQQNQVVIDQDKFNDSQNILIGKQKVLSIRHLQDQIDLDNVQVPYQMVFSAVSNTLENNE